MLAPAVMPHSMQRSTGTYASLNSSRTAGQAGAASSASFARAQGVPPLALALAAPPERHVNTAGAVRPRSAERSYCSFNVDGACKHSLATRQCFGCVQFDSLRGRGYFCEPCFAKRHPFHRLGHNFRMLFQRPPSPPVVAMKSLVAVEVAGDTVEMLRETRRTLGDLAGDASERLMQMGRGAAACDALLQRLAGSVLQLRDDDFRARQRAARLIQTCWRLRKGRKLRRTVVKLMWGKCLDPSTDTYFYVNRKTGHAQWEAPRFAGRPIDVNDLPRVLAAAWNEDGAASAIQATWRTSRARANIRALILSAYRRVTDKETGQVYYFNMLSRRAQWRRPFALRPGEEPSEYIKYEDDRVIVEAAVTIQRAWRRTWGIRLLRLLLVDTYERVLDPASGTHFYFNKKTGESTWKKPLGGLVGEGWDVPLAADDKLDARGPVHTGKVMDSVQAAAAMSTAVRMWRARMELKKRVSATWRKIFDKEYAVFYYFNRKTGESVWAPPLLLRRFKLVKKIKMCARPKLLSEGPESASEEEEPEPVRVKSPGKSKRSSSRSKKRGMQDSTATVTDASAGVSGASGAVGGGDAAAADATSPSASVPTVEGTQGSVPTQGSVDSGPPSRATSSSRRKLGGRAGSAGVSGSPTPSRSGSRGRRVHQMEITTIDILRMHYNRLRAYYAKHLPGRVARLAADFRDHGTYLWTAIEVRMEGTTGGYTRGLPYLTAPWLYLDKKVDVAQLMAPPPAGSRPATAEDVQSSTFLSDTPVVKTGLKDSDDPESLGVVLRGDGASSVWNDVPRPPE